MLSPILERADQQIETSSGQGRARKAGNEPAGRHDLFEQHQDRKSRDPQHVHDAADKEQGHQNPAATDAVETMLRAEPQRSKRFRPEATAAHQEPER